MLKESMEVLAAFETKNCNGSVDSVTQEDMESWTALAGRFGESIRVMRSRLLTMMTFLQKSIDAAASSS
eukprot:2479050-Lingulodinium_polyedra.AAC.1